MDRGGRRKTHRWWIAAGVRCDLWSPYGASCFAEWMICDEKFQLPARTAVLPISVVSAKNWLFESNQLKINWRRVNWRLSPFTGERKKKNVNAQIISHLSFATGRPVIVVNSFGLMKTYFDDCLVHYMTKFVFIFRFNDSSIFFFFFFGNVRVEEGFCKTVTMMVTH